MQNPTFESTPITLTFPESFYIKEGLQRYYKIISEPKYTQKRRVIHINFNHAKMKKF